MRVNYVACEEYGIDIFETALRSIRRYVYRDKLSHFFTAAIFLLKHKKSYYR